jgi:hypothetical protein
MDPGALQQSIIRRGKPSCIGDLGEREMLRIERTEAE